MSKLYKRLVMKEIMISLLKHAGRLLLVIILNAVILLIISLYGIYSYLGGDPTSGEYFEVFKYFILITIFACATIAPGYVVFLILIRLPVLAQKLSPWDVIALCFLLYLLISQFIPLGDEVNIMIFSGVDKIFAIIDILLFAALNYTALKDRGNQFF